MESLSKDRIKNLVWGAIIAAICLVFILEFGGPQAQGCAANIRHSRYAAKVRGHVIPEADMRNAFMLLGYAERATNPAETLQFRKLTLDGLIESELLAQEAQRLGFALSEEDVMVALAKDAYMYIGSTVNAPFYLAAPGRVSAPVRNEKGVFDKEGTKRFIQNYFRRSIPEFARWQMREMLAYKMRSLITSSVVVSDAEAKNAYVAENDKATVQYVRLSPALAKDRVTVEASALSAWVQTHQEEINKAFTDQKARFTKLPKQVRARHILLKVDAEASPEDKEKARKLASDLLKRAKSGEDFAKLAMQYSEDPGSAIKGGDLGFNPKGRMVEAFDKAQFSLPAGAIADAPIETNFGFHVIKVEAIREGDVPAEQAKQEVAEDLYRQSVAKAEMKRIAEQIIQARKAGNQTLEAALAQAVATWKAAAPHGSLPSVQDSSPFGPADDPIPGLSGSEQVRKAAFALSTQNPLASAPIQAGDEWVVIELKERTQKDVTSITASELKTLSARLLREKQQDALKQYVGGLRKQADKKQAISLGTRVFQDTPI